MTTREQAIEIAAKAVFDFTDYPHAIETASEDWDWCEENQPSRIESAKAMVSVIYDALLAAGVIPAEGMVVVDAKRKDAIMFACHVLRMKENEAMDSRATRDVVDAYGDARLTLRKMLPNDLDAIPDAPTGEGER